MLFYMWAIRVYYLLDVKSWNLDIHLTRNPKETSAGSKIKICDDCKSAEISITEDAILCKRCGAIYAREGIPRLRFQPGDMVRVVDSGREPSMVYKIEKINQGPDGMMHYIMKCDSTPIILMYDEGSEHILEKAQ